MNSMNTLSISCSHWTLTADGIQYLNRDGRIKFTTGGDGITAQVASWDLLYNILRANFDGGHEAGYVATPPKMEGDGIANYVSDVRVTDLTEVNELVEVEYEGVDGRKGAL